MNLKKNFVKFLFLQLIATTTCYARIVTETSEPKDFLGVVEAVARVVTLCHEAQVNTIGIAGRSPNSLVAALTSEAQFSVILIDHTTRTIDDGPVTAISRNRLQIFVIAASSAKNLRAILVDMKSTKWWNHLAKFYIIEWPAKINGCSRAIKYLRSAWSMNILEAKFVCANVTKERSIYSFNPYTSNAPKPWRLETVYRDEKNRHPWSLLVRKYSGKRQICENMDFDKTNDLGGYAIRVTVKPDSWEIWLNDSKAGIDSLSGNVGAVFTTIFRSLNATMKLLIHSSEEPLGSVGKTGEVDGLLMEMSNGSSDIGLNQRSQPGVVTLTWTYPHYYAGLSVMTRYSGSESQLTKIVSLIDQSSRIGLCIVCLVTLLFFKYFLRQTSMIATLSVVRMICNSCLTKLPRKVSSRIYLACLFFFVVTIQGIYQGQLSSLLAKRVRRPDIDTMQDLARSNHTIYGHKGYSVYFRDRSFDGRFVGLDSYDCTEYVLLDPWAACVRSRNSLIREAVRHRLHLSKEMIVKSSFVMVIRKDWPLERKVNKMIQSLVESDVIRYSAEEHLEKSLRIVEANDNEYRDRTFKFLTIEDLAFAFVILGIGLAVSAMSFLVEMISRRNLLLRFPKMRLFFRIQ